MNKKSFLILLLVIMTLVMVAPTFAQSDSITVDTGVFISEINNWLPMALTVTAIGVGVAGAFALALFVGRMLLNAFNGRL